jgi:porin
MERKNASVKRHGSGFRSANSFAYGIVPVAFVLLAGECGTAAAADSTGQAGQSDLSLPGFLRQLSDWNGQRTALERKGLTFTFTYYGDAFANPVGGVKQGVGYDGRFGTIVDADLEKLVGWSGAAFHASVQQIHGTEFSATNLNNLMPVSGIEAPTSTRLFNLWIEQNFGASANMRVGQFTAAQEFMVSRNANLFVNSSFGWPAIDAADLPSGGPAYAEATPGVRLQYKVSDQLMLRSAAFNGDPAGPGSSNPVDRDPYGLAFRVNDPPFFIVEAAYSYGQTFDSRENPHQEGSRSSRAPNLIEGSLPGTIKLGAWYHSGTFADVGPVAASGTGNYAVYGVVDQMLWRVPGTTDQGLSYFLRGNIVPSSRNLIDSYIDAGLTYKGALPQRPDDIVGLAVAYGRISPDAAEADRAMIATSGTAMPIRDFEAAIELTYEWQVHENWFVQPDLQYIVHPGGNIAKPSNPTSALPNALVVGTRTTLRF